MDLDEDQQSSLDDVKPKERVGHAFRNLKELVEYISGKPLGATVAEDAGLSEAIPFPFLGIVGQKEMKLALLLGLINPAVGGILLIGPRGTAKTTAVRSLLGLLPMVDRSLCYYGCLPEDITSGGMDGVCPDCARKFLEGHPLTAPDRVRLIELPLNARLDDVVGTIDEKSTTPIERMRLRRGILAQADRNLLYIDEINLLADDIIDAILDAAAQGAYTIRRGLVSATYRSRFVLIGSMNPEEGKLRPQIQDRFGLRVIVRGLQTEPERWEAYNRVRAYLANPRQIANTYKVELRAAATEIQDARANLSLVKISSRIAKSAIKIIQKLGIDSLRAEITWFEAARAYAAADGRKQVLKEDLFEVAPMVLRLRRSAFIHKFFADQQEEEKEIINLIGGLH